MDLERLFHLFGGGGGVRSRDWFLGCWSSRLLVRRRCARRGMFLRRPRILGSWGNILSLLRDGWAVCSLTLSSQYGGRSASRWLLVDYGMVVVVWNDRMLGKYGFCDPVQQGARAGRGRSEQMQGLNEGVCA